MSEIKPYDRHTQALADFFIAGLKDGTGHLRKKWDAGTIPGYCYNFTTGKAYRGGNQWALMSAVDELEKRGVEVNGDLRFGTYKQSTSVGAQVRKGEKGLMLMAWKEVVYNRQEVAGRPDEDERGRMIALPFTVFHASQMYGLPPVKVFEPRPLDERLAAAQIIVDQLGVPISYGGDQAYYSPALDRIQMPDRLAFVDDGAYMATLLHECVHSTGHPSRLSRKFGERFGDPAYALEELRAELGSFELCRRSGVPFNPDDHVHYVNQWIQALENDPREIMRAASDVEKIMTYMKVPELEYERVAVIEKEKELAENNETQIPDQKATMERLRNRSVRPGAELSISL